MGENWDELLKARTGKGPARPYRPGPALYAPNQPYKTTGHSLRYVWVGLVAGLLGYCLLAYAVGLQAVGARVLAWMQLPAAAVGQPAGSERVMAVEVPLQGSITFWLAQGTTGTVTVKDVSIQLSNPGFVPSTPLQRRVPLPPIRSSLQGRGTQD